MIPLISFLYTAATLVFVAVLLTIRKTCENLNKLRDFLGLFSVLCLNIGGFVLINYSPKVYFVTGAIFCIFIVGFLLYKELEKSLDLPALLVAVIGAFAVWPSFISYNLYCALNTKVIDEVLLKEKATNVDDVNKKSDDKDV